MRATFEAGESDTRISILFVGEDRDQAKEAMLNHVAKALATAWEQHEENPRQVYYRNTVLGEHVQFVDDKTGWITWWELWSHHLVNLRSGWVGRRFQGGGDCGEGGENGGGSRVMF